MIRLKLPPGPCCVAVLFRLRPESNAWYTSIRLPLIVAFGWERMTEFMLHNAYHAHFHLLKVKLYRTLVGSPGRRLWAYIQRTIVYGAGCRSNSKQER
jgi:hypothetical protein